MNLRFKAVLASSVALSCALVLMSGCAAPNATGGSTGGATGGRANASQEQQGVREYVDGARSLKSGDIAQAETQLKKALDANPNLRMPHIKLGEIYRERQDYQAAVPHLEAVAKLDPYNQLNHYFLGLSYQLLNRLQDSALAYLRALKLDAKDNKSTVNLGLVYYSLGQIDPSIFYLERSTQMDPSNPRAWSNLGVALDGKGKLSEAETAYRKAIEIDPGSVTTLSNLTNNLLDQGRAEDAAAAAVELTERAPTAGSFRVLGSTLARGKQWSRSQAALDRSLSMNPRDFATLNAMADMNIARYAQGLELDDSLRVAAVEQWKASLALKPDQPMVQQRVEKHATPAALKNR